VCNKVLDSAAQSHDAAMLLQAADLAEALSLQGVGLERRTLWALAHGLGRHGLVDRALPLADQWLGLQAEVLEDDEAAHQAPLQLLTHLMECAARADEPETVLQVLARLARVGLAPTAPSVTSLLQSFMRLGQVDAAHSVVEWMRRNAMAPSAYTYTALLTLPPAAGIAHARTVLLKVRGQPTDALVLTHKTAASCRPRIYCFRRVSTSVRRHKQHCRRCEQRACSPRLICTRPSSTCVVGRTTCTLRALRGRTWRRLGWSQTSCCSPP
jgi:hypothetical protein